MAPTRVGIIGLSKNAWWARQAHFPYLNESDEYQIVAICNSSVESSQDAIKHFNLPATTKAYGDPEDLAKDQDVDLVVCSVRVDKHSKAIAPALRAGKDVYVEWPLGKSLADAEELLKLKKEGKVKVANVGLQARQAPIIRKVKALVESGSIGEVLSSTWTGYAGNGGSTTTEALEYLGRREVGGNLLTIHFGHAIDYVQQVLGYGFQSPPKSLLANRRKTVQLLDSDGKVLEAEHSRTAEDTIFLHGVLSSSIALSMTLRGGDVFKGSPGLDWRIYGSKAEIRISAPGIFMQIGYQDMKLEVYHHDKDSVEVVDLDVDEFDTGVGGKEAFGIPARNVARVYKALKKGEITCSFEDAVERHALLEGLYKENGISI